MSQIFTLHDWLCGVFERFMKPMKWALLFVAHASLLGIFFPQVETSYANLALIMLLFLLLLSPLSKLFRMRLLLVLMGYRREMGILMGYFATVHAIGVVTSPDLFDWSLVVPYLSQPQAANGQIATGIMTYFLTLPLLFTSNTLSQKLMKRNWKRLHMLVYPLLFFALFHKLIFARETLRENGVAFLLSAVLFLGYVFLKWLAHHPDTISFIRIPIQWVADRYREYQQQRSRIVVSQSNLS